YVPEVPDDAPRVLGMASYLHSLVGETDKARELALRGLAMVEESGDQRAICHALSDLALAEELVGKHAESGRLRRRQMEGCDEAGDGIFRPTRATAWARCSPPRAARRKGWRGCARRRPISRNRAS